MFICNWHLSKIKLYIIVPIHPTKHSLLTCSNQSRYIALEPLLLLPQAFIAVLCKGHSFMCQQLKRPLRSPPITTNLQDLAHRLKPFHSTSTFPSCSTKCPRKAFEPQTLKERLTLESGTYVSSTHQHIRMLLQDTQTRITAGCSCGPSSKAHLNPSTQ